MAYEERKLIEYFHQLHPHFQHNNSPPLQPLQPKHKNTNNEKTRIMS
jgi:hypothetical protein